MKMKNRLNRALSVLFAILTIVSLCTSPIMAEEVNHVHSYTIIEPDIVLYESKNESVHTKRIYYIKKCSCGHYKSIETPEITEQEHCCWTPNYKGDTYKEGMIQYFLCYYTCICNYTFTRWVGYIVRPASAMLEGPPYWKYPPDFNETSSVGELETE